MKLIQKPQQLRTEKDNIHDRKNEISCLGTSKLSLHRNGMRVESLSLLASIMQSKKSRYLLAPLSGRKYESGKF